MKIKKFKPLIGRGDSGYTDIFLKRVPKTDLRIKLNAILDEVNAYLALIRAEKKEKWLLDLQKDIILLSSNIAGYNKEKLIEKRVKVLDNFIDKKSKKINVNKFIIFGQDYYSSIINLLRAKIRICEIISWQLKIKTVAKYLNRLSDFLFVKSLLLHSLRRRDS